MHSMKYTITVLQKIKIHFTSKKGEYNFYATVSYLFPAVLMISRKKA